MRFIENLVLETPYLFLKKIPYAWIALVALWAWPPVVPGVLAAIIALGIVMMLLQQRFWEAKVTREFQKEGEPYRVQPRMPLRTRLRNLGLVLGGSALLGLLLKDRFNLTGVQWFLLAAGLMLLYRDAVILGASTVYLVTPRGIGVRYVPGHIDYRLFFRYGEINYISRIRQGDKLPAHTDVLSPVRGRKEGVLLVSKRMDGFSPELGNVLLTPDDPDAFMQQVPATLIENVELIR